MTQFLNNEAKGTKVIGADSLQDMVNKLKTPRKIMLLVKGNLAPQLSLRFVCVCASVNGSGGVVSFFVTKQLSYSDVRTIVVSGGLQFDIDQWRALA